MASISRGTTPTISLNVPGLSDLNPAQILLTLKNSSKEVTYDIDLLTIEENVISVMLTQQDTLEMTPGSLYIQARILSDNDKAYKTPLITLSVEDILKDGIIARPLDVSGGISELITIVTQPNDFSGSVGSDYKLTVEAKGDTLNYQWQSSTDKGQTWTSIEDATESTYSSILQSDDNEKLIRCWITDVVGETKASDYAKLTVK